MNFYLRNFLYFLLGFVLILLVHLFIYKKEKKKGNNISVNLMVKRNNIDLKKTKYKKVYIITSIINSFIVSFTSIIIINIENVFLKLAVGFVLIMVLIYSLYEIIGGIIKRNENVIKKSKKRKR